MEKPKNLYVQPMDMNCGRAREGNAGGRKVQGRGAESREKNWDNCNSIIDKIYF